MSTDAIVTKTLSGVITGWNPGAERIFGYSAQEAIGRPMLSLFPPELAAQEADLLDRLGRGEQIERLETVRVRKDGSRVEVAVSISPVKDGEGRIVGALHIAHDISDRKNFERRLLSTLRELQDIKAALDEHSIVAITDAAGRITYVNDKFCSISKYAREELLGQDHRIINSRFHPREFFRELWGTIRSGKVWHGEIRNRAKDGSHYWVDTTIYPRLDEDGRPQQFVAIRTDITQRKADEAALLRSAVDLAQKNKELETIVYTVSHDLRSPLVNVQGFGRQLARACDKIRPALEPGSPPGALAEARAVIDSTVPQALRFINAGVAKMEMLLAGLLRYSRLGREVFSRERIDMNALLAEILAAMKFQADSARAEIKIGPLPDCIGDRVQTGQVFANLLDNALKYAHPDRAPRISVTGRVERAQAIYTVTDNGIGIPPEHQAKAFEIFHRLNPESVPGEGLGLTIAQRVLERQGGSIRVESTGAGGSAFIVTLEAADPAH